MREEFLLILSTQYDQLREDSAVKRLISGRNDTYGISLRGGGSVVDLQTGCWG